MEELIFFVKEFFVIVVCNERGEMVVYLVVECEFNLEVNFVEFFFVFVDILVEIEQKVKEIVVNVILWLNMVGLFVVEFFLIIDGDLLVNEIVLWLYNSGYYIIECNIIS